TIFQSITPNGLQFLKNLITLLKINIEYYMNEISYLLNDLYASSPSIYPTDTMKNYSPIAYTNFANNNLLAYTLIFHRNHVPTILEMFQFIYHFISTITYNNINDYLDTNLVDINPIELARIRDIVKLLYYQIFGYFMNVYDSFNFE